MRVICMDEDAVRRLEELGAEIRDLTPSGLDGTPYHLLTMTTKQARAVRDLNIRHEDVTPKVIAKLPPQSSEGYLYSRGGKIPNGTKMRTQYKTRRLEGEVRGGLIWIDGKSYGNPSYAARAVGRGSVNGWQVWEYYDKDERGWFPLRRLRTKMRTAERKDDGIESAVVSTAIRSV